MSVRLNLGYVVPSTRHAEAVVFSIDGYWYRVCDVIKKFKGNLQEFIAGQFYQQLVGALEGSQVSSDGLLLKGRTKKIKEFDPDHFRWLPMLSNGRTFVTGESCELIQAESSLGYLHRFGEKPIAAVVGLGVVIGKSGTNISAMDASAHILGYTCPILYQTTDSATLNSGMLVTTNCSANPFEVKLIESNKQVLANSTASPKQIAQAVSDASKLHELQAGDLLIVCTSKFEAKANEKFPLGVILTISDVGTNTNMIW